MRYCFALLAAAACSALATPCFAESWEFVWVARSYDWLTVKGKGDLKRTRQGLEGDLLDLNGTKYRVKIKMVGRSATGQMEIVPSDSGVSTLKGTFQRNGQPGPNNCWETIQLYDGHNFLGLSRNSTDATCEP